MQSLKYMHSFLIVKFYLNFIENKSFITSLYLHEIFTKRNDFQKLTMSINIFQEIVKHKYKTVIN
jgi:hypothetical protein